MMFTYRWVDVFLSCCSERKPSGQEFGLASLPPKDSEYEMNVKLILDLEFGLFCETTPDLECEMCVKLILDLEFGLLCERTPDLECG